MENLLSEIDNFLNSSNFSENTIKNYGNRLHNFAHELSLLTDTPVEELHLLRIYEIIDNKNNFVIHRPLNTKLVEEYFSSKINNGYYSYKDNKDALGSFFNYLNRNYDFPNLVKKMNIKINKYRSTTTNVDILSRHDILRFFHYTVFKSSNRNRDVLLFILFLTTGCRSSEISSIRIKNISLEENLIYLPKTKHNRSKYIPLRPGLSDSIKSYCEKMNLNDEDFLFNLDGNQMRELFYKRLKEANLPKVKLHSLRHSFATLMVDSGSTLTEVQQLLGHADIFTTKGYVHSNIMRNKRIKIKENDEIFKSITDLIKKNQI